MKENCIILSLILLVSCQRDFDIEVKPNAPQLVVEAYVNNERPEYNYVLLSRSQDYFATGLKGLLVDNAKVTITEGSPGQNNTVNWDRSNGVRLTDASFGALPENFLPGVYFDPRLVTDFANSLRGVPGKYYLLEIETEGNHYSAITAMPFPVPIDSLSAGFYFHDPDDSNKLKARLTINYQDPDTLGNAQLIFRRSRENRYSFGWGGLNTTRRFDGTDDITNGEYMRLTVRQNYNIGDTVTIYMASVSRPVYNFWDSFYKARDNVGLFATPVVLMSNILGNNVTGCFSGFSTNTKTIIVRPF